MALLMDDVDVSNVHMETFMATFMQHRLDVAAPSITNPWFWRVMNAGPASRGCLVRKTLFVDMLFTVFTQSAFACWQGQLDLSNNRMGWGYDQTLGTACNVTIGVLDDHSVRHVG